MKLIKLTQGKFAKVDDTDFEWLDKFKWYARKDTRNNGKFYAGRTGMLNGKRINIHMHREIMQTPDGMQTDHKDGDGLNCQRENMRNATKSNNMMNKKVHANSISKYKGVSPLRNRKYKLKNGEVRSCPQAWQAAIQVNKKRIYLGYFDTPEKAAIVYNEAAIKHHGEFANLNTVAA